jgi:hypothetical protein
MLHQMADRRVAKAANSLSPMLAITAEFISGMTTIMPIPFMFRDPSFRRTWALLKGVVDVGESCHACLYPHSSCSNLR